MFNLINKGILKQPCITAVHVQPPFAIMVAAGQCHYQQNQCRPLVNENKLNQVEAAKPDDNLDSLTITRQIYQSSTRICY